MLVDLFGFFIFFNFNFYNSTLKISPNHKGFKYDVSPTVKFYGRSFFRHPFDRRFSNVASSNMLLQYFRRPTRKSAIRTLMTCVVLTFSSHQRRKVFNGAIMSVVLKNSNRIFMFCFRQAKIYDAFLFLIPTQYHH